VRYKQTALGASWAILQPLLNMVIFTVVFGNMAKIPSDGLPYPIFAFTALLPWTYFSQGLNRSGMSLVNNAHLITKIYFPRLLLPLSALGAPTVDFALSFLILLGLMTWYGITPTWSVLALPLLLLLAILTAITVGLWLAPINVKYRDVSYTLAFLTQFWMYASPVVYPVSLVPEKWRWFYSLNPMVGVIEGFRWALLGKQPPSFLLLGVSACVVSVLFLGGIIFFKRMERNFADVI